MSDLAIMFDEAYDAPNFHACLEHLQLAANQFNMTTLEIVDAYNEYTDSDQFYASRGM